MKKKLVIGASYVAVAAIAIGGTAAYLTSTDSDVNVMTMGNVKIEQNEYERSEAGELIDFTQAKPLYPAVGDVAWDEKSYTETDHNYKYFADTFQNVQDKIVTVTNTGKGDAYVRTIFAFECGDMTWTEFDQYIGINVSDADVNDTYEWSWEWLEDGSVCIDGVNYWLGVATYVAEDGVLASGDETAPSLRQVYLASDATNAVVEQFGDTYEILVTSQAVQTQGFSDAAAALNEAFGEITSANHPWSSTAEEPITGGADAASAVSLDDILKTGTEGETRMVLNVAGNVSLSTGAGHGSTMLGGENTEEIVLQGNGEDSTLVATGAGVGEIMSPNGRIIFKDMTIVDNSVSYAEDAWEFTYLEFGGELYFENCTFTSGIQLENAVNATFVNCTFQSTADSEYSVWVSDGTAVFSDCTFTGTRGLKIHEAYGSNVDKVVVDNCFFDQITVKPGIAIGTLDAATVVTITNSTFNKCQAGDQGKYIYETDTAVDSFEFTEADNTVVQ